MENEKQIKEVDPALNAQWDDIKKAYREHMKASHPELQATNTTQVVQVKVEEAQRIEAAFGELKKFVTETGSFYGIPEEVVEAHIQNKRRTEVHVQEAFVADSAPTFEAEEVSENRRWMKELFNASAAFLCFTIVFVGAFQTGVVSASISKLESAFQGSQEPVRSEFVGPIAPAIVAKNGKKATAKVEKKAEEPLQVSPEGLLSFDEVQRRRSRAQLATPKQLVSNAKAVRSR